MTIKILKIFAVIFALVILGVAGLSYWLLKSSNLQRIVVENVVGKVTQNDAEKSAVQKALGFDSVRTYLILFLNNTEMRPGGGFIGVYALLQMDKGVPHLLKVEGTEILDNLGKKDFDSVAPAPISKNLKVSRWFFRDSNWSPDFASSSQKSIELFLKEGGAGNIDHIDAVVGFTPTVIEEVLKIHGPITVDGQEFNAQNFTEKLEYEVEYGYVKRGEDFAQRKNLLSDLAHGLLADMRFDIFKHYSDYYALVGKMFEQKQMAAYASDANEQQLLQLKNWTGVLTPNTGDYVLWADANLGSLKTDAVMNRELSYSIAPSGTDKFVATAKMKLTNTGKFDWRTSRYRDYARVFVPVGSSLLKADPNIDQGVENGRQWFGTFLSIEPGHSGEISFTYNLPDNIAAQIKSGDYKLNVDKEIGTIGTALTLGLDFGKKLVSATPGEETKSYGDNRYDFKTVLDTDKEFKVKLVN